MTSESAPDLILHRGLFTTLDRRKPSANAVAIKDGRAVRRRRHRQGGDGARQHRYPDDLSRVAAYYPA